MQRALRCLDKLRLALISLENDAQEAAEENPISDKDAVPVTEKKRVKAVKKKVKRSKPLRLCADTISDESEVDDKQLDAQQVLAAHGCSIQ